MSKHNSDRRSRAAGILSKHGYGKMAHIATETDAHEKPVHHKGKKETKKMAHGGCALGGKPHDRLDRKPRAAGGRNKHHEPKVSVNVINAGKEPVPMPMPGGAPPMGAKPPMPPQAPPPQRPPMAPPPGAPMAGGMPQRPPGMMNAGGRAKRAGGGPVKSKGDHPHLIGGSGGGLGRLEKQEHESKRRAPI